MPITGQHTRVVGALPVHVPVHVPLAVSACYVHPVHSCGASGFAPYACALHVCCAGKWLGGVLLAVACECVVLFRSLALMLSTECMDLSLIHI